MNRHPAQGSFCALTHPCWVRSALVLGLHGLCPHEGSEVAFTLWQLRGFVCNKLAEGGACGAKLQLLLTVSLPFSVLPGSTGQLDTVDLNKLNEIEGTLNKAKDEMKVSDLDRKVSDLENEARKQEAAIMDYNRDIEEIMKDIRNLEDIRKTLPSGCFNTPSIEKP